MNTRWVAFLHDSSAGRFPKQRRLACWPTVRTVLIAALLVFGAAATAQAAKDDWPAYWRSGGTVRVEAVPVLDEAFAAYQAGCLGSDLAARAERVLRPPLGRQASTKIGANASRHSARSHGPIEKREAQLKAEGQELFNLAEQADQADVPDGVSLPEEIQRREDRLAAMVVAKTKMAARAEERYPQEKAEYDESEKNIQRCEAAGMKSLIAVATDDRSDSVGDRRFGSDELSGNRRVGLRPKSDLGC